ncbi:MAG: response regulator transcription factor [Flavobacteriales bacterium]|nr:response regulator transcription factor [Flavobacteriales bacterium]
MKDTKIFIVEDEPLIAMTISTALKKSGFLILGEPATSISEAKEGIANIRPDLVLIDINLEGSEDGVTLAHDLEDRNIPYIYITSQTDPLTLNRVKSTNPLTYVVKPFTETGLRTSVEIAWHNHVKLQADDLVFTSDNVQHIVKQIDVLYLKAFDNYCYLFTQEKKHLIPRTLKSISEQLDPRLFVRCHRSFVVNKNKVISFNGNMLTIGSESIPVSRSYRKGVKDYLAR